MQGCQGGKTTKLEMNMMNIYKSLTIVMLEESKA